MAPPNVQPNLPAEGAYGDMERLFIEAQPKGLWPENQNSNIGLVRRVLTDVLQSAVNKVAELYNELFIDTSSGYMSRWEKQLGLPDGTNLSVPMRRALIANRRKRGLLTRARLNEMVQLFVLAALGGEAVQLIAAGVSLVPGGVPLHSDVGVADLYTGGVDLSGGVDLLPGGITLTGSTLYLIKENTSSYSYEVRIHDSVTIDVASLTRELEWMTPSGISFSVVQSNNIYS